METIVLPVVSFGCGTPSLTFILREEHRLRVFVNRVLKRMFGPMRDEAIEVWRKLHNEELHNFYSSPGLIRMIKLRRMRFAVHVARMGAKRNACRILLGKPEGKRLLGRPRHRREDNIKSDLKRDMTVLIWIRKGTNGGLF
jgi:hypothetical protein